MDVGGSIHAEPESRRASEVAGGADAAKRGSAGNSRLRLDDVEPDVERVDEIEELGEACGVGCDGDVAGVGFLEEVGLGEDDAVESGAGQLDGEVRVVAGAVKGVAERPVAQFQYGLVARSR